MDQVPKVLKPMVQQWVPEGFIVSFKLETDMDLLIPKASAALDRYGHQIVVANDLHSRKEQVCFVFNKGGGSGSGSSSGTTGGGTQQCEAKWLRLKKGDRTSLGVGGASGEKEIEEEIVKELTDRHDKWISEGRL